MEPQKRPTIQTDAGEVDIGSLRITQPTNGEKGNLWVNPIAKALFKDSQRNFANELLWEVENAIAVSERLTRTQKSE